MEHKNKNKVISQMFDVRPVDEAGNLDLEKINKVKKFLIIEQKFVGNGQPESEKKGVYDIRHPEPFDLEVKRFQKLLEEERQSNVYQLGEAFTSESVPVMYEVEPIVYVNTRNISSRPLETKKSLPFKKKEKIAEDNAYFDFEINFPAEEEPQRLKEFDYFEEERDAASLERFALTDIFLPKKYLSRLNFSKVAFSFSGIAAFIFLSVLGIGFFNKGISVKNSFLLGGKDAYASLTEAKAGIISRDFQRSSLEFNEAYGHFNDISNDLNSLGSIIVNSSRFIPYFSQLSSGKYLAEAGKDVSKIGILSGEIMQIFDKVKNPINVDQDNSVSFLKIFQDTDKNLREISTLLVSAQNNLSKVNSDDIPGEQRMQFVALKNKIPDIQGFINGFLDNSQIFTDILGGNGPRKYLFLFQNNQELRATGGFIGTYGILDISNGRINNFFIDGIFNPDGQLKEKIVPPGPIQKISAAWSLHDSNWFPDFPASAEKAASFYEKTGGPTVDGVITMTPTVMQKLLEITGPIDMPEYGVTVDKDNFIQQIQYEVEVDYDKKLNQPKKILADLAPKILDKIFNTKNFADLARTLDVLVGSLNEKQILIYSKNYSIESLLSAEGWSGEVLKADKDYLSVINTNINGFKTDGVIDEKIDHSAEIQPDGSVIDNVTITRHHNGGNLEFDWWNKVNADYMRVYVPKGSKLLSAEGQTREFDSPPLDYNALGFKRDPQIQMEEDSAQIDQGSGTKIYDDANKTVFANWVYVSPQETVTIKYKYLLPFKLAVDSLANPTATYSLLVQKQSGSLGSHLASKVSYPENYQLAWRYPDNSAEDGNSVNIEDDLKTDKFLGLAFEKK